MLLNSIIIILREVLEAAILISVMLSLSHFCKLSFSWLKWSLALGLGGALIYAENIALISEWFGGVGQEIINASLQYLIYLMLAGFCIWFIQKPNLSPTSLSFIQTVMTITISLSMVREFSEIIIFLSVYSFQSSQFNGVMLGALLGFGIGLSMGIIIYYLLNFVSKKWSIRVIILTLGFIAAGMLSQATQLLIQADWLPSQQPLWDTSHWISENSVTGQLLYAIFGYEATPSLIQLVFYLCGLFIILFFIFKEFLSKNYANRNV